MTDLFPTKEKKDNAIIAFEGLLKDPGWQLLESVVKQNIEVLEAQLKHGDTEETLDSIRRLREKIEDHTNFIETPKKLIAEFSNDEDIDPSDDPYV